jgi:alpha-beta hydrolase superfamily lysophospholipase
VQAYPSPVKSLSGQIELAGKKRFQHQWLPKVDHPWASVTLVHGFGDHGGRFEGMGTSLASLGLAVSVTDLVGHGRSPGKQGCIASYDELLDDVEQSIAHSQASFPHLPHFLFGQSMGGNLVLNLAIRRPDTMSDVRGIIAGSPMLRAGTMPKQHIMDAGRWLAEKIPNWRIKAPMAVEKLSSDRRAQDAYLMDRWVHRNMSLRLAANLIDSGQWALENACDLKTPTLISHGLDDTLTSPEASRQFALASNGMAKFKGWSGCRHDLHDEVQRERFFAYLTHWMKHRCILSFSVPRHVESMAA